MGYDDYLIVLIASGCNPSLFVFYSSHSGTTTVVMDSWLCAYSRNEEKATTMYCLSCMFEERGTIHSAVRRLVVRDVGFRQESQCLTMRQKIKEHFQRL